MVIQGNVTKRNKGIKQLIDFHRLVLFLGRVLAFVGLGSSFVDFIMVFIVHFRCWLISFRFACFDFSAGLLEMIRF